MTVPTPARRSMTRDGLIRFLRFCVVGGVGFVVDASILMLAVTDGLLSPIPARFLSFGVAVFVTFNLNRRWSFDVAPEGSTSYVKHLVAYLGVQGFGFLCNLVIYAAALALLPGDLAHPVPCLVLASASVIILNYLGADLIVFRHRHP